MVSEIHTPPRLTIAIPTLQRRAFLEEAVRSALAQATGDIEVLISQDALADGTLAPDIAAWSQQAVAADSRVRYVSAEGRALGLAGNWNRVADLATGDFLTIIGDDDRVLPEFAGLLLAEANAADVVFGHHYIIDAAGQRQAAATARATARFHRDRLQPGRQDPAADCVWRNAVPMSASVVRTTLARTLRFAEDLNTPDIEFFARAAASGARFHFVPTYVAEYRVHQKSATSGGLTMGTLLGRLTDIPVPAAVEPQKAALLCEFADGAVRSCLLDGDIATLRRTLTSPYSLSAAGRALAWLGRVPVAGDAALAGVAWTYRAARRAAGRAV